jgi:hypothetical protein
MHEQRIVAVYPSRTEAKQALRAARGSGIPSRKIQTDGADISVLLDGASDAKIKAWEKILRRYRPLDVRVKKDGQAKRAGGPSASAAPKKNGGLKKHGEEQIIPLPREEPKVGAKATDWVRHVRTYVVSEPFERKVSLSDEHWVIDRRPATASKEDGGEISEREYEFHERHEEPVVGMETRTAEELVVRKESTQHTESVRGTARRTEVKIEKETSVAAPGRLQRTRPTLRRMKKRRS